MGENVNTNESAKVQGFVEIELVSKDGVSRTIKQNTVTTVGKLAMLARSGNDMMMGFGGSPYGRLCSVDLLGQVESHSYTPWKYYTKQDNGLNNYLVNLPQDIVLTGDSKFLPVFDNEFNIDYNKLIGFANSRTVSANVREGVQEYTKPTYMIDDTCIANRWKYAEGVGTGTFNHLVIAPGIHGDIKCNGVYVKKCISKINQFNADETFGNKFIIPNVPGITGPNEILLNDTKSGMSRWRYNLATGEMTQVESSEIAYTVPMFTSWDQVYADGHLYVLDKDSSYIHVINVTTGQITNSHQWNKNDRLGSSMYYDGTNVIVMGSNPISDSWADNNTFLFIIRASDQKVVNAPYKYDYAGLDGLPAGFDKIGVIVKKQGDFYYVHQGYQVIKCTDIMNIKGSVVGTFLAHPSVHYVSDSTNTWMIERGQNEVSYKYLESNGVKSIEPLRYNHVVKNNSTERQLDYVNNGIWVSKEQAGNIISFVKLSTPIEKTASDIMYVSYGYKFV